MTKNCSAKLHSCNPLKNGNFIFYLLVHVPKRSYFLIEIHCSLFFKYTGATPASGSMFLCVVEPRAFPQATCHVHLKPGMQNWYYADNHLAMGVPYRCLTLDKFLDTVWTVSPCFIQVRGQWEASTCRSWPCCPLQFCGGGEGVHGRLLGILGNPTKSVFLVCPILEVTPQVILLVFSWVGFLIQVHTHLVGNHH